MVRESVFTYYLLSDKMSVVHLQVIHTQLRVLPKSQDDGVKSGTEIHKQDHGKKEGRAQLNKS